MNVYMYNLFLIVITIAILSILNIASAVYWNVGKKKHKFDLKKLLQGIFKALIVLAMIGGLTYVWVIYTQLGVIEDSLIDPYLICYITSIYYFVKVSGNLIKILGVEEAIKKKLG